MKRYVECANRFQSTLFPESLEDYIAEGNPVRVVDVFVDELDLKEGILRPLIARSDAHSAHSTYQFQQ
jgi:hypothetical protein